MHGDNNDDPDHFDAYSSNPCSHNKIPMLNKNSKTSNTDSVHSSTHKDYSPVPWNAYFE